MSYVHDFWNHKLNPITMLPPPLECVSVPKVASKKGWYITKEDASKLTEVKVLMEELGIGCKRIKTLFRSIGVSPKSNDGKTYYNTDDLDLIKDMINEKK